MTKIELKKGGLPVIKKMLKLIMIIIMVLGITLSIVNFISTETQAIITDTPIKNPTGTMVIHPDGSWDCQGPPLDC